MKPGAKLRWSRRARADLSAIGRYIADDDPRAARAWVERLRRRAQLAAATPASGRVVPEYARADLREALVRSYRIVYQITGKQIVVLAVVEGHRLMPADLA